MSSSTLRRVGVEALLLLAAGLEVVWISTWSMPTELVLSLVAVAGLLVRRRLPIVSVVAALPAFTLAAATFPLLIALFSLAVVGTRTWLLVAAGAATVVASSGYWWGIPGPEYVGVGLAYSLIYAAGPIALGLLVRTRGELSERLAELTAARQAERERERQDVLRVERARISREMHDVVSHQVSLIAVQAGGLQVAAPDGRVRETAVTIRSLAVRTLEELRQVVSVLRADGAVTGELAPQPSLEDLPRLIDASGLEVELDLDLPRDIPPAVQRALYRTVQEGLTNARKHAPGASVTVTGRASAGVASISIASANGNEAALSLPSSGSGIAGLRERAELLGGSLETERRDGGFTLRVRIPFD